MQRRWRERTKQRNSRAGFQFGTVLRRMRWYGILESSSCSSKGSSSESVVWDDVSLASELSSSSQSWNTCSKSWVMKSELLRRR